MKSILTLSAIEAREHFLKESSYFNADLPEYISFKPILDAVAQILGQNPFIGFTSSQPAEHSDVNYVIISNKDGRFAWRALELIHPVLYVSLVNQICTQENWVHIQSTFNSFKNYKIFCCSIPVISSGVQSDKGEQISHWWQAIEQRSIILSLEYSIALHTDVSDCYGSLYTHSIPWALHGQEFAKKKENKQNKPLIGNTIDFHMQAGRYGQTNGIPQGSVLMDFIAEIVLGYVDTLAVPLLKDLDVKILRYRDDYRIFAHDEHTAEYALKIISDTLRTVGLRLNVSKTSLFHNVVGSAIKQDKLAGIELRELDVSNAKTFQKQLLRLHSFGIKHPNSGALRRLMGEIHGKIVTQKEAPSDLAVQIAIVVDISIVSPTTFPAAVGILSHLISLAPEAEKQQLWEQVAAKVRRIPYNGYQEIWLQRVMKAQASQLAFHSDEPICGIVDAKSHSLWNSEWVSSKEVLKALDTKSIITKAVELMPSVVQPAEIELFVSQAEVY